MKKIENYKQYLKVLMFFVVVCLPTSASASVSRAICVAGCIHDESLCVEVATLWLGTKLSYCSTLIDTAGDMDQVENCINNAYDTYSKKLSKCDSDMDKCVAKCPKE